ncbi:MAG: hypothetical protein Q7O66_05840 [Dehalococcoidia bacterium]|nr:hypothetical protein [Dehalococcoidia bacterium]
MTRIADLQKKYPKIPMDTIVKWEMWGAGVRDSGDLDKASEWKLATGTYQNKFDEVTLKEVVDKNPARLKDVGLDCITIQLEVWDRDLFGEILPGKVRHCSFDGWLESVQDAVDIFGVGNPA